jgi:selenocysteine lyase/cysteine desulfurase
MSKSFVKSSLSRVRDSLIGNDCLIETPFGHLPILYADYTASGRNSRLIEDQMDRLSAVYANPHTTDSATGRASGHWLHRSEEVIKNAVNANEFDCLISCGFGASGAIHKLQEVLGISLPPVSRDFVLGAADTLLKRIKGVSAADLIEGLGPVVFIGPYEHHSNELTWREGLADVVRIDLTAEGQIDLDHLRRELKNPVYDGRRKIGSFSAASNVTGVISDVIALAEILHEHDAIFCLDCAASAPYLKIDMHPENHPNAFVDAVFFSPHKFVGGPGSSGVLVFNEALYRRDLPPTQSAGGTVKYVWKDGHDFIDDIEARERAGTPGVPQIARAALAMKMQSEIGLDVIHQREQSALERAFSVWECNPSLTILGPAEIEKRVSIVSFTVHDPEGIEIHPRFITILLNDLFGIQSRAGCSCAGPYGHDLLNIDDDRTLGIREAVLEGNAGMRPGWCRVSVHWVMDDDELDYLIQAVDFVGSLGWLFLSLYRFDPKTGSWNWRQEDVAMKDGFPESVLNHNDALKIKVTKPRIESFKEAMGFAYKTAVSLANTAPENTGVLCETLEPIRRFSLPASDAQIDLIRL